MRKIYLSVVVPCYQEERNIRLGALEKVADFLSRQSYLWEVLLVDDGSDDESVSLIKSFILRHNDFKLIEKPHRGKASTVTSGVMEAKGEVILFTDLDQATPIDQIDNLLPYFQKGYDVVIGSRDSQRRGAPFLRRAMAVGFMFIRNAILNLGISDTQCGFKAFRKDAARDIFGKLKVYKEKRLAQGSTVTAGFDVELLYIAKKSGYKIKEVPVEWHYQETRRVNPIKDSWEGFYDLLRIKWNNIKGIYDKSNN